MNEIIIAILFLFSYYIICFFIYKLYIESNEDKEFNPIPKKSRKNRTINHFTGIDRLKKISRRNPYTAYYNDEFKKQLE